MNNGDSLWAIYFAPTLTEVGYGNKKGYLVLVNSDSDVYMQRERAYPLNSFEYYHNDLYYLSHMGVKKLGAENQIDVIKGRKTIGYGSSGVLKNTDLYYFLTNENYDKYIIKSKKAMFNIGDTIYYIRWDGKVYSFNTQNYKLEYKYKLDFEFDVDADFHAYYDEKTQEIHLFYDENHYINKSESKYCMIAYDLNGNEKDRFYYTPSKTQSKNLRGLYPHAFIKIR